MDNPTIDYENGRHMGMLFILRLIQIKGHIPAELIDKIERRSMDSIGEYLQLPSEDVTLMVDRMIQNI